MSPSDLTHVHASLDRWLDASTAAERQGAEGDLARTEQGRWWLAVWPSYVADLPAPDGHLPSSVLRRLPEVTVTVFGRFGDLVLRAWGDPQLRQSLRDQPRQVLEQHGVWLPEDVEPEVVTVAGAMLPGRHRLPIPLPDKHSGPVSPDQARRQLADTPFAWLWGPPWAREGSGTVAATRPEADLQGRGSRRWFQLARLAPELSFAAAAAALVVAVVWWGAAAPGSGSLVGTAVGGTVTVPVVVLLGLAVALAGLGLWLVRRR